MKLPPRGTPLTPPETPQLPETRLSGETRLPTEIDESAPPLDTNSRNTSTLGTAPFRSR